MAFALYSEDTGQIKNGVNGILNAPDIVYVEIKKPGEKKILYKSGISQEKNSISKSLKVNYSETDDEGEYISLEGATFSIKLPILDQT